MNGVHDMGGWHGHGPVDVEPNEPVFHSDWEARVFAMSWATFITYFPVDETRAAIERIPPSRYLDSTYYERWLHGLEMLLVQHGHITAQELASGAADRSAPPPKSPGTPMHLEQMRAFLYPGVSCAASVPVAPRFAVGDRVRVCVRHPETYTRAPRYVRGKRGIIVRDFGAFAFPDTMGERQGEHPQHVYSVRFAAQELWGTQASPRDALHVDLYDDHLEPA